jgi:hypothetical protein
MLLLMSTVLQYLRRMSVIASIRVSKGVLILVKVLMCVILLLWS